MMSIGSEKRIGQAQILLCRDRICHQLQQEAE